MYLQYMNTSMYIIYIPYMKHRILTEEEEEFYMFRPDNTSDQQLSKKFVTWVGVDRVTGAQQQSDVLGLLARTWSFENFSVICSCRSLFLRYSSNGVDLDSPYRRPHAYTVSKQESALSPRRSRYDKKCKSWSCAGTMIATAKLLPLSILLWLTGNSAYTSEEQTLVEFAGQLSNFKVRRYS